MLRMRPTGFRPGVNSLQAHQSHQPLNMFSVDFIAQPAQMVSHRPRAPGGRLQVLFIDEPHQLQILSLNRLGSVVIRGSLEVQQPTLPGNAQIRRLGVHHLLPLLAA